MDLNKIKNIHFVGVGGVSMRALARLCLSFGMLVSGSDLAAFEAIADLKRCGVHIAACDDVSFIPECDVVVYSAAVPQTNPQLSFARAAHVPTLERKAFLGFVSKMFGKTLAVAGTHGKTTVTAMICAIFERAGASFTGHIGGETCAGGSGLITAGREWFITEACEYNRSFLTLAPFVSVVLNMQFDHPDCYRDREDMKKAYDAFVANTCVSGCVVCYRQLLEELATNGRRAVTFGYSRDCDVYPEELDFRGGKYSFYLCRCGKASSRIEMNIEGKHNVLNALAACAAAGECGISDADCAAALSRFSGVKGRYEHMGRAASGARLVYDYAHHPTEIEAAVNTARQTCRGKIVVIFEPHTFSRTRALMKDFVDALSLADEAIVLPTYKAREEYTPSGSGYDLYCRLNAYGSVRAKYAPGYKEAAALALSKSGREDIILMLGAGNVRDCADYM